MLEIIGILFTNMQKTACFGHLWNGNTSLNIQKNTNILWIAGLPV
jgi:hypothetical protein